MAINPAAVRNLETDMHRAAELSGEFEISACRPRKFGREQRAPNHPLNPPLSFHKNATHTAMFETKEKDKTRSLRAS